MIFVEEVDADPFEARTDLCYEFLYSLFILVAVGVGDGAGEVLVGVAMGGLVLDAWGRGSERRHRGGWIGGH